MLSDGQALNMNSRMNMTFTRVTSVRTMLTATACFVAGACLAAEASLAATASLEPWFPPQEARSRTVTRDAQSGEWTEERPPEAGTSAGDLHFLREDVRAGLYRKALSGAKRWEKTYGKGDVNYPDVILVRTQAMIALRQYDPAHTILLEFLNEFDGTSYVHEALRQEFMIAEAYLGGAKRRFLWIKMLPAEDVALKILDDLSTGFPDDKHAELAIKTKGDHFQRTGENELAELEYVRLMNDHPQSRYMQYALRRAADSAAATFGGVEYDEAPLIEAENRYEEYARRYPDAAEEEAVSAILETMRAKRADKALNMAQYYERSRHPRTAVFYYQLVVRDWPGTLAEQKARERLSLLGAPLESQPVVETGAVGQ